VSWLWNGPFGYGTFYVAAKATTLPILRKATTDLGVSFQTATTAPTGPASKLRKLRIGLVDNYGGSMPVGWTRLIFEDFEFPFVEDSENDVFGPDINAGNLHAKYDVLVFNGVGLGGGGGRGGGGGAGAFTGGDTPPAGGDTPPAGAAAGAGAAGAGAAAGGRGAGRGAGGRGAGAAAGGAAAAGAAAGGAPVAGAGAAGQGAGGGRGGRGGGGQGGAPAPGDDRVRPFQPVPEKYAKRQGAISAEGMAALKQFVQDGGTIVAIAGATNSAISMFGLPLTNHLVKADGSTVGRTEYYVPGSVLTVAVDAKNPVAHGYSDKADVFFDNNPVWTVGQNGGTAGVHAVAWFPNDAPLKSGWAWGQKVLDKGVEMAEASVGKGRVFLFGNELLFRAQPQGNFKFFFNALYLSVAPEMKAGAGQ
jgi:hypothetical protein